MGGELASTGAAERAARATGFRRPPPGGSATIDADRGKRWPTELGAEVCAAMVADGAAMEFEEAVPYVGRARGEPQTPVKLGGVPDPGRDAVW